MKPRTPSGCRELLRRGRWFGALADGLQDELLAAAHMVKVARGTQIIRPGGPPSGLYAVVEGSVRLASVRDGGDVVVHMFSDPPSWFGEVSAIDGGPQLLEISAALDSELVHIGPRDHAALLARRPELWRELARLAAYRIRLAVLGLEESAASVPLARLARRLAFMVVGYGDHEHTRRALKINQEDLAMTLHISRQTTNQLLKELENRGLVRLAYGAIEILDPPGLHAAGQGL